MPRDTDNPRTARPRQTDQDQTDHDQTDHDQDQADQDRPTGLPAWIVTVRKSHGNGHRDVLHRIDAPTADDAVAALATATGTDRDALGVHTVTPA